MNTDKSEARAEVRNATIETTFLGIEDHGILALTLILEYGDSTGQGYVRRVTPECIRAVLTVAGVDSWEHLRGRHVRARIEGGLIRALGHITRDLWTDDGAAREEAGNA